MTVSSQTPINRSTGNGVTTVFPYGFKIISEADIEVTVDGVAKTLNVDYTVSGVGNEAGGNVTMTAAPANLASVVRRRNMALVRTTDYQDQGEMPAETLDNDFDAAVLMIQQVDEQIGRAMTAPASLAGFDGQLPAPIGNYILGIKPDGSGFQYYGPAESGLLTAALASASGASIVGYLPSGTGAVAATVQAKLRERVSVNDFGAKGDGITDDTVAIQQAIDSLPTTGGIVEFPSPSYKISASLNIGNGSSAAPSTKQNIYLRGRGNTYSLQEFNIARGAGTQIVWAGAAGGTMLNFNGPIVGGIRGITLDCAGLANTGLNASHVTKSRFEELYVRRWLTTGIVLTAFPTPTNCYTGANDNSWIDCSVEEPSGSSNVVAIKIGINASSPSNLDVARNTFTNCCFFAPDDSNSTCILLQFCDIITFIGGFTYSPGAGRAVGVRVIPPTGNLVFPSEIAFYNMPILGGVTIKNTWNPSGNSNRGLHFWPYNTADGSAPPTYSGGGIHGITTDGWFLDGNQLQTLGNGVLGKTVTAINRSNADITVVNTVAATNIYSFTVPGGTLKTTGFLRLRLIGEYLNNSGSGANLQINGFYGGGTPFTCAFTGVPTGANPRSFQLEFVIASRAGSAASQQVDCRAVLGAIGSSTGLVAAAYQENVGTSNALNVDSTVAQTLAITAWHSAAAATISITVHDAVLEII